jgi:uncharacterized protein (UPF0147 family)
MSPSGKPEEGSTGALPVPTPMPAEATDGKHPGLLQVVESLTALSEDTSVPRNIRRGAQAARGELGKPRTALDVRIASAVYVLDDLANDPNLPTHGRTALWSIMSSLESLQ